MATNPDVESGREPWSIPYDPHATLDDIFYCFRLLLGRSPHREEWRGHSGYEGAELEGVVSAYLLSLEFQQRGLLRREPPQGIAVTEIEGFKILTAADDLAVSAQLRKGSYEPGVTSVFRRFVKPGMNVVDVGANIGYYTMLSASIVGPTGHVLAVEPNPQNVKLLEASRRVNGFDNVTAVQAAAGRATGLLILNSSYSNGTTSDLPPEFTDAFMAMETVPCLRLDALTAEKRPIRFIKIDVEGAEYNALLGCQSVIESDRPVIVTEFSPGSMPGISHIQGEEYLRWLTRLRYRLGVIEPEGSVGDFDRDIPGIMSVYDARASDHLDILAQPQETTAGI
ncbi:MAG TPA: FkbM family methyltransferase [Chloroflexota bacterium]|nr:FkbM family methyltransferase [Chloroflexota bacterium]